MRYIFTLITVLFLYGSLSTDLFAKEHKQSLSLMQTAKHHIKRAKALHLLDSILSPFEDMTEYALADNSNKVLSSLKEIQKREKESIFKHSLSFADYTVFTKMADQLKYQINSKNNKKIVLLTTEIFHYNVRHFKYSRLIKEQIIIENLDYMGFRILALLKQNKINYQKLYLVRTKTLQLYNTLKTKVKDPNIVDSFNLLFQGLNTSIKQKNIAIIKIFASLDLALVDVLEKQFS